MVCSLLCSSAVRVHVSHAYINIDTTSDPISLILDQRMMFLSFHIGFSLVIAAVVWAILEMIWFGSFIRDNYKVLELGHCFYYFSIRCDLLADAIGVVGHKLGFLSTDFHSVGRRCIVEAAH